MKMKYENESETKYETNFKSITQDSIRVRCQWAFHKTLCAIVGCITLSGYCLVTKIPGQCP